MKIFNINLEYNFLECVATFVLKQESSLENKTIFFPSRRSGNDFKRVLLNVSQRDAILLPTIKSIGDIDYDELLYKDVDNFFADTSRTKYKILLVKELIKWKENNSNIELFESMTIKQICDMGLELERFLDEISKNELDINDLKNVVDDEYAKHWQEILLFLQDFTAKWNKSKKDNNIISNTEYTTNALKLNADYYRDNRPINPIIIVGVVNHVKSSNNFIKSLSKYNNCYFIFRGLDIFMDNDEWKEINATHPQFLIKHTLENVLNSKKENVINLDNII
jgi:ATP-dependent helicase/nuclease subunit B